MSLLTYSEITNPASSKDVLNRIRTFALAQGWTVGDYRTDVNWEWTGSKYEWVAASSPDDYDFLQLYSNGLGSHNIIIRFAAWSLTHSTNAGRLEMRGTDPSLSPRTPDDSNSQDPWVQDWKWFSSRNNRQPLAPSTMPKMWLFGDDKFIIVVVQTQTEVVQSFCFGLIEMFDPTRIDGFIVGASSYWNSSFYPYDEAVTRATSHLAPWGWWNNGDGGWWMIWNENINNTHQWTSNLWFNSNDTISGDHNEIGKAVKANAFTGKRVLIKPTIFFRRSLDNIWEPVGTYPIYHVNQAGLNIAEIISYGLEDFIVFPNTFPTNIFGWCARIA